MKERSFGIRVSATFDGHNAEAKSANAWAMGLFSVICSCAVCVGEYLLLIENEERQRRCMLHHASFVFCS